LAVAQTQGLAPRKGDLRKIKIIEGAIECIAKHGIEKTNFETIGNAVGMLRAHVAYYFPHKNEILLSVIKYCMATAQQTTVQRVLLVRTDWDRFIASVDASFDWAEENPNQCTAILLLYYYCRIEPEFLALHSEARELGNQRLAALLTPLLPKRLESEILDIAHELQVIITGYLVDFTTTKKKETLKTLRKKIVQRICCLVEYYQTTK
jgi:AcrR family transcriptional regulator